MTKNVVRTPHTFTVAKIVVSPGSREKRIEVLVSEPAVTFSRHEAHPWGFDKRNGRDTADKDVYVSVRESASPVHQGMVNVSVSGTDQEVFFVSEKPQYCMPEFEWASRGRRESRGVLKIQGLKRTIESWNSVADSSYVKINAWEGAPSELLGGRIIGTLRVVVLRELKVTVRIFNVTPSRTHTKYSRIEESLRKMDDPAVLDLRNYLNKLYKQVVVKFDVVKESYSELCQRLSKADEFAGLKFDEEGIVDMDLPHNAGFVKAAGASFVNVNTKSRETPKKKFIGVKTSTSNEVIRNLRFTTSETGPDLLLFHFWKYRHLDEKGNEAHGYANVPHSSLVDDSSARTSCVARYYRNVAMGREDEHQKAALWHVIAHELGHLLGLDDVQYLNTAEATKTDDEKENENNTMVGSLVQDGSGEHPPSEPVFRFRQIPLKEGGTESQWMAIGRNGHSRRYAHLEKEEREP
jgi:hypothetical protein